MIYNRQYQKILSAELLRYLLLGRIPNLSDISQRIGNALGKDNNVTYKYVPQPFREVFQNEVYNKSLRKIKFDIDVFHEDLLQLFSEASSRLNYADLFHKVNSYELKRLQSELEILLFTVADADFYFAGAFDTFSDTSKIDSSQSTKDIIDLSEQCLVLPFGGKNTQRIDVGSLINTISTSITISEPGRSSVISNSQIPGTLFGNIFSDVLAVWGQEVITSANIPLDIVFTFPLNPDGNAESEFFVSRFEIIPHVIKKQTVTVSTSNDDVNYISILGYEQGFVTDDQKKTYALDFETTLVQYVKIKLSKTEADEEILVGNEKRYKYLFGLKKFSAYQTGRFSKATYVSKPFTFNSTETIGKVSIDVEKSIPPGCDIKYLVAGVSDTGIISPYIPITPIETDSSIGANKVVTFNSTIKKSNKFTVTIAGNDAAQVYGTSFQGKDFYRIGPALDVKPIFGTGSLFRGFKSWYRDSSGSFEIVDVVDNYISFEHTDLEALYTTDTESAQLTSLGIGTDDVKRVKLQVSRFIYYDSTRGHALKPQPGTQNPILDTRPNYAIYKVLHSADSARKTATFVLNSSRTQYLPSSNFITQSNNVNELPVIRLLTSQITTPGVDYIFETIDIGGVSKPTGRIIIPNGSLFLDPSGTVIPLMLEFLYTIDPDITHKVSRIDGNTLILDHSSNTVYDSIKVTYRYIPTTPSMIIKSSVRVSNLPSTTGNRIFYVEGRDYVLDPTTGGIQRIPTGEIGTQDSVYIQFSYRSSSSLVETFITWAYVSATNGTQIKFDLDATTKKNKLIVDTEVGESFYVNSKDGLINLTKATVTPVLPFGWIQFIVRSKNPGSNATYKTNLIDQVIQLKDFNRKKIFREYNAYFNEITAFREPMVEKTLNHLKVNTLLSDHSCFAIDNITSPLLSYIVLNFSPNNTSELYNRVPTDDTDESNPPEVTNESFLFTWNEKADTESSPTKIIIRIDLNRNQDKDGALTPKLFSYKLRVGS